MYIKYKEFKGMLLEGDIVLMSHDEFENEGKNLINVPICITPNGDEPLIFNEDYQKITFEIEALKAENELF